MKFPSSADSGQYLSQSDAATWAKTNGGAGRPQPPRNLKSQSAARKVQLFWDLPLVFADIVGWKVYKDNESQLLDSIYDPNVRQYNAAVTSGATPPTVNLFVSSFSKRSESVKVQVQGTATAESGAPSDPAPPAGSAASGDTGKKVGIDGFDNSDQGITR